MKVAFYVHALAATGVVRNVRLLAGDFHARGHDVTLVTALPGGEGVAGVPHHALLARTGGSRMLQKWRAIPRLHAYLRRARPDILLSAGNHGHLTALLGSRVVPGLRRIYRISNDLRRAAPGTPGRLGGSLGRSLAIRLLAADADRLVLVSPTLAVGAFARALAEGRAHVIENAIDPAIARASAIGPSPHGCYDDGVPVIVAIGRLAPQKNFGTLLTAFAQLRREGTVARLVILGESRDRSQQALRAQADALGVGADLLLPGTVDNVFPWLTRAGAFVLPSWWEGSANVLLEAMALDVPVVASRSAGNADSLLGQGRYGLLVDPSDPAAMAQAMARQIDPTRAIRPGDRIDAYRLDAMLNNWARAIA
ncbi:D-inositol-3-phosphate glycosyltransferase [Sphingobium sp. AntQ-1]|uniref:glycosyltransferase n=1 Tax=Sphingobium sp. AntQ-1 TaxID=2930091 RepID=UPI00234F5596|nr:glycosyltransferase [Sphingobium sp. AntQ-1]WCP13978.1 D-inositol-3-phosphate glycosyltransferase [Sphingobium sp. AntQ-1]